MLLQRLVGAGSSKMGEGVLVVQGAAIKWCARRVSDVVVGKGLPTQCAKADAEGSLHFALRSIFWRPRGRRRGARAVSARALGDGS